METNGNGKALRPEGFYQSESGAIVELHGQPGIGTPTIDAFVQAGYKFIGTELPKAEKTTEVVSTKK